MKPFDLEQAKAGKPVQEDNCVGYYQFSYKDSMERTAHVFKMKYHDGGEWIKITNNDGKGLFMAPEKKTVWVNVYMNNEGIVWLGDIHDSKEECEQYRKKSKNFLKTIPIEI